MRIGFISTRLAGTDGVSLETAKLATVLTQLGHECFYCAGELGPDMPGLVAPELHFRDSVAADLHRRAFGLREAAGTLLPDIYEQAEKLKAPLCQFLTDFAIEYVIPQNIFAIPMQLPLARALAELMSELKLPGLAHNHDFYWEQPRYVEHNISAYLDWYFPPELPRLTHAVINSLAQASLKQRRGIDSVLLPNVFDFGSPPAGIDEYNADFRDAIGLSDDDWLILQPTQVVPRKGIELAIEMVAMLADSRAKLIITHHAGDEGREYLEKLQRLAAAKGVDMRYVADLVDEERRVENGQKIYALRDAYPNADLITYPSFIEGFGNALLETIYFKRPALVNNYPVYTADIGPLGFRFAIVNRVMTPQAVAQAKVWLENPALAAADVGHNFSLGAEHFSHEALATILQQIVPAAG